MNLYPFDVECGICGQVGKGDFRANAAQWFGGAVHTNPSVCRDYLDGERQKLEKERKELQAARHPVLVA